VKVHELPDFAYFNHSVHVNRGVSCVECHGKINEMEVVTHTQPLSMGFCLECHRNPAAHVRQPTDIYNLNSDTIAAKSGVAAGEKFVHDWNIKPPQSCTGCHR
jgi:formate-dependent nitrite reductase cytochrome c552 subunit